MTDEIKRPIKKEIHTEPDYLQTPEREALISEGHNRACNLWEAYHNYKLSQLPTKEEIFEVIIEGRYTTRNNARLIATAIHNRLDIVRKGE